MLAALREKSEKLAPPGTSVAPIGKLRPAADSGSGFSIAHLLAVDMIARSACPESTLTALQTVPQRFQVTTADVAEFTQWVVALAGPGMNLFGRKIGL